MQKIGYSLQVILRGGGRGGWGGGGNLGRFQPLCQDLCSTDKKEGRKFLQ